jgi:hypothetical protein
MLTKQDAERHIENLHEHAADIMAHPFIEDSDKKLAVLSVGYGLGRYVTAALRY